MRNEVGRNEKERIYGRRQSQALIERMENVGGNEIGRIWGIWAVYGRVK